MLEVLDWGCVSYDEAYQKMQEVHSGVVRKTHSPCLIVVQHPPVVTMGNRNLTEDLLLSPEAIKARGVDYQLVERGGSATVHELGQQVIYPIVPVQPKGLTVRKLVCLLEQSMIDTCKEFGVEAARDKINPGVWVGMNKVGALGIRVKDKVSFHGIALNLVNTLETFALIVPCGLRERGVTSLFNEQTQIEDRSDFEDKASAFLVKTLKESLIPLLDGTAEKEINCSLEQ